MSGQRISVEEHAPYPGPRFRSEGEYSGQQFRESVLVPALKDAQHSGMSVVVLLSGVPGYGASFLEEAFGGLIREHPDLRAFAATHLKFDEGNALYRPYRVLAERYLNEALDRVRI